MNTFYNLDAAKGRAIQEWAIYMEKNQQQLKKHLAGPAHILQIDRVDVKQTGFPVCHKAVYRGDGNSRHEVEFSFVGMLLDKELPPVKKTQVTRNNMFYARQQVSVVGLNTPAFDEARNRLMLVAFEVERAFEAGDVAPFTPAQLKDERMGVPIDTACRYYTFAKEVPLDQVAEFGSKVDRSKVLKSMLGQGVHHCVDNQVAYLNLANDKLVTKDPTGFRVGDIVEVGVTLVGFKGPKEEKSVVKMILRSIIFLDGSHTRAAAMAERHAASNTLVALPRFKGETLKRAPIYEDEESDDENVVHASKRMQMKSTEDIESYVGIADLD